LRLLHYMACVAAVALHGMCYGCCITWHEMQLL